jgi:formiminotetrahydrofolate cyclodeaminase
MTDFGKLSLEHFLDALASNAPTPGGGTAAAVGGAMGASLAEMVAALTLSKEKYAASHDALRPIAEAARHARREFVSLAREDSAAYESVVAARRLPKETEEQKADRAQKIAVANKLAAEVPMRTAQAAVGSWRPPELAARKPQRHLGRRRRGLLSTRASRQPS